MSLKRKRRNFDRFEQRRVAVSRGAAGVDKDVIKMQINMTKGYNRGRGSLVRLVARYFCISRSWIGAGVIGRGRGGLI